MIKTSTSKIQFTAILLVSMALSAFISFTKPASESKKVSAKENETDKLNGPNEWFYLQRSYPDQYLDINAYHHSMQSVSESINNQSNHREKLLNGWNAAWTTEGPGNIGGRINVVTIDPTDNNIIYLGNSTGGVFKTTDGGITWNPIFDIQSYLSVSTIVLQPGNHNTIYVGTGDANITGSAFIGDGIYKSTDGGVTWNYLGLSAERIISKIVINPQDTNIIYAGTMGIPYFQDANRGLYKSTDGGLTWNNILFVSDSAGIIDLVMDSNHPDTLYAASWNRIRNNNLTMVHGYDAKIWKTIDGGATWTTLGGGLPQGDYSRISLSMSGVNHNTIFASYSDTTYNLYGIYKSTNNGGTWTAVPTGSLNNPFNGQGWYSGGVHVNPTNDNELWLCGVDLYKTTNGGNTWSLGAPDWAQYIVHGDMHDVEFTNATTIYLTTDGGAYKTTNDGGSWTDIENLPNNQFYHITYDPINIGVYAGGVQDNGCTNGNASTINNWGRMNGGDGFGVIFHPTNSQVIWTESQNGAIQYSTNGGLWYLNGTNGINNGDVRNWDMQYIMSSANPNILYTGTTKVYKNTGGTNPNWQAISNNLIQSNFTNAASFHTITCLCESPVNTQNLYVGTSDGLVWSTTNGGTTWNNVTSTLPNRYVTSVKTSQINPNVAYVTHSGYKDNDNIPHVHKTTNNGTTWTDISGDLPQIAVNCIMTFAGTDNILFLGTDGGVYGTVNGGTNWIRIGNNMPVIPTYDLELDPNANKLLAGTFARSLMSYPMDSILLMTGMNTVASNISFNVYPNPAADFINVKLNQKNNDATISIYNETGEKISSVNLIESNEITIPISSLSSGIYFLRIEGSYSISTKRFVKL